VLGNSKGVFPTGEPIIKVTVTTGETADGSSAVSIVDAFSGGIALAAMQTVNSSGTVVETSAIINGTLTNLKISFYEDGSVGVTTTYSPAGAQGGTSYVLIGAEDAKNINDALQKFEEISAVLAPYSVPEFNMGEPSTDLKKTASQAWADASITVHDAIFLPGSTTAVTGDIETWLPQKTVDDLNTLELWNLDQVYNNLEYYHDL